MLQFVAPGTVQRTSEPGAPEMVGSCACAVETGGRMKQASASVKRTVLRIGLTIMKSPLPGLFDALERCSARIGKPEICIFELRSAACVRERKIQNVVKLNRARLWVSVLKGTAGC